MEDLTDYELNGLEQMCDPAQDTFGSTEAALLVKRLIAEVRRRRVGGRNLKLELTEEVGMETK
jgi:hypothetical protein